MQHAGAVSFVVAEAQMFEHTIDEMNEVACPALSSRGTGKLKPTLQRPLKEKVVRLDVEMNDASRMHALNHETTLAK
jgi:hypothetical protein